MSPDITPTGDDPEQVADERDIPPPDDITLAAIEYRQSGAYNNLTKPSREYFTNAMQAIKIRDAQLFKFAQMDGADIWQARSRLGNFDVPREPSDKTRRIIDRIRAKHPTQFSYGARCGFYCSEHDVELFKHWTAGERDAFFAGYNAGRNERLRVAASKKRVA